MLQVQHLAEPTGRERYIRMVVAYKCNGGRKVINVVIEDRGFETMLVHKFCIYFIGSAPCYSGDGRTL
jgi:hypothetical protein